jgi:hypothetical protein
MSGRLPLYPPLSDEYTLLCQRSHRMLQAPDIPAARCKALLRKKSNAIRSAIELGSAWLDTGMPGDRRVQKPWTALFSAPYRCAGSRGARRQCLRRRTFAGRDPGCGWMPTGRFSPAKQKCFSFHEAPCVMREGTGWF